VLLVSLIDYSKNMEEAIAGRLTKYRNHRSCLFLPNNIRGRSSLKGSKAIVGTRSVLFASKSPRKL
jgi:hypothetical protein